MRYGSSGLLRVLPLKAVIPNLEYAYPQEYKPGYLGVREKLFHCFLLTVTAYKFEVTTTILITNILIIWRVQFMEIDYQGARKWEMVGNHCLKGSSRILESSVVLAWYAIRYSRLSILDRITVLIDVFYPCCLANNGSTLFCACWNWNEAILASHAIVILAVDNGWTIHGRPAYWSCGPENKHPQTLPKLFSVRSVVM